MNFKMSLDEQLKEQERDINEAFKDLEQAKKRFMESREELDKMMKDLGSNKGR